MNWSDGLRTGDRCIDSCHSTMFGCLDKMYEAVIVKDNDVVVRLVRSFQDLCVIHGDIERSLFGHNHSPSHSFIDDVLAKLHPQEYLGHRQPVMLEVIHNLQRAVLNDVFHDRAALNAGTPLLTARPAAPLRPGRGERVPPLSTPPVTLSTFRALC